MSSPDAREGRNGQQLRVVVVVVVVKTLIAPAATTHIASATSPTTAAAVVIVHVALARVGVAHVGPARIPRPEGRRIEHCGRVALEGRGGPQQRREVGHLLVYRGNLIVPEVAC